MSAPIGRDTPMRKVITHARKISSLSKRPAPGGAGEFEIKVFSDTQTVVAGDGAFIFAIPKDLDGTSLTRVELYVTTVSSSGIVQVQIRNVTQAADMLSTRVQCDASEFNSKTAATAAVIGAVVAAWADLISIDVDAAGTGPMGLGVILEFS